MSISYIIKQVARPLDLQNIATARQFRGNCGVPVGLLGYVDCLRCGQIRGPTPRWNAVYQIVSDVVLQHNIFHQQLKHQFSAGVRLRHRNAFFYNRPASAKTLVQLRLDELVNKARYEISPLPCFGNRFLGSTSNRHSCQPPCETGSVGLIPIGIGTKAAVIR